jgi:hypothetical protein
MIGTSIAVACAKLSRCGGDWGCLVDQRGETH